MYEINRVVRSAVENSGLKVWKIAEKSGIKESAIGAILRSQRRIYADELLPLCSAVGLSVEKVLADIEKREA